MSTTYDLKCLDCKEQIWICQGDGIYTGDPKIMELLRTFLFVHERHHLRFVSEHESHDPGDDGWIRLTEEKDPEDRIEDGYQFYKERWNKPEHEWFWRT